MEKTVYRVQMTFKASVTEEAFATMETKDQGYAFAIMGGPGRIVIGARTPFKAINATHANVDGPETNAIDVTPDTLAPDAITVTPTGLRNRMP